MVGSEPVTQTAAEVLDAIIEAADDVTREALINEFIRVTEPMNKSIAMGLCRDFKADRNTWLDEICQYVRIAAHALLVEVVENPDLVDEIGSWRGLLYWRARNAVVAFIDSSAGFNQASGMVGAKRRLRELEKTRTVLFTELQREPSDQEIVDETNKRMAATRSDYKRQGMECKVDDLYIDEPVANIDDHHNQVGSQGVESDSDLHSTERRRLINLCIAECTAESEGLGDVARLWFAPALEDDYDGHPNATEIGNALGIAASTARSKIARVLQVARQVARTQYGIRQTMSA